MEHALDHGRIPIGADHARIGRPPTSITTGVEDNGFARAGFTGQDDKSWPS